MQHLSNKSGRIATIIMIILMRKTEQRHQVIYTDQTTLYLLGLLILEIHYR